MTIYDMIYDFKTYYNLKETPISWHLALSKNADLTVTDHDPALAIKLIKSIGTCKIAWPQVLVFIEPSVYVQILSIAMK